MFYHVFLTPHRLQQRKQELFRDNATLGATLQAARDTLVRLTELLRGMDQAKEVSTPPPKGLHAGRGQIRWG